MVGLAGFENHHPHQLSGGMRKRVALAQTFINNPEILLMDEPFSALDMQTRTLMQDELLQLWAGTGGSVVFITHDLEEAIALADRVFVLSARPCTLKRIYEIALPRPRVMSEIRYDSRFIELSKRIWADLREEASRGRLSHPERARQAKDEHWRYSASQPAPRRYCSKGSSGKPRMVKWSPSIRSNSWMPRPST